VDKTIGLAVVILALVGCGAPGGQTEPTKAASIAKGKGVIGTWTGTETDESGMTIGSKTHNLTESFKPDGTYECASTSGPATLTTTGTYQYDESTKLLNQTVTHADMGGGSKVTGMEGPLEPMTLSWDGADHVTFKHRGESYDLTRK